MKEKTINVRVSQKTLDNIKSIKEQLLSTGLWQEEDLTNSFIIRQAITTLEEKAKYFLWIKNNKTSFVKNKEE